MHSLNAKARGLTDRMECWSVNPFLLIILAGTLHIVTSQETTLGMAPDAVDDVFSGCRDKMLKMAHGDLLHKELKAHKDFEELWKKYNGTCKKQIYGGTPYHLTALEVYGNSRTQFRKEFNSMVHTKGNNATTYTDEFTFKSLHFLLTDAMQLLNGGRKCHTVYYGTNNQYTSEIGMEVRFGKFIRSEKKESTQTEKLLSEDTGTLFTINSCSVVDVENYTCTSNEIELLISPTEVFRVQNITDIFTEDGEYKNITLTHARFLSNNDCYLFPSAGGSSNPLLGSTFLALMASFLSLHYCAVVL